MVLDKSGNYITHRLTAGYIPELVFKKAGRKRRSKLQPHLKETADVNIGLLIKGQQTIRMPFEKEDISEIGKVQLGIYTDHEVIGVPKIGEFVDKSVMKDWR